MAESHSRQRVARHRPDDAEEVVQPSHPLGQLRLAQDPAAAQPGESITLRQTAGRDELRAEGGGHRRRVLKEDVAVDFINQNERAGVAGNLADLLDRRRIYGNPARIVRAGDDDQSGSRRDQSSHFIDVDPIAVLEAAREAFDIGAQIFQRAKQRVVSRLFDQHFVAALDCRRHRQEIGHRGSLLRHDLIRAPDAIFRRDGLLERPVAFLVLAVERDVVRRDRQVVQIAAEYAAVRQIVAGGGVALRPGYVNAVFHLAPPEIDRVYKIYKIAFLPPHLVNLVNPVYFRDFRAPLIAT